MHPIHKSNKPFCPIHHLKSRICLINRVASSAAFVAHSYKYREHVLRMAASRKFKTAISTTRIRCNNPQEEQAIELKLNKQRVQQIG